MPYRTEVLDGGRGLRRLGTGVLTCADILNEPSPIGGSSSTCCQVEYTIVDLNHVTDFRIGSKDLELIRARHIETGRHITKLIIAFVAPTDVAYGMCRMQATLLDISGWQTSVFRKEEDAREWLIAALPPPTPSFRSSRE